MKAAGDFNLDALLDGLAACMADRVADRVADRLAASGAAGVRPRLLTVMQAAVGPRRRVHPGGRPQSVEFTAVLGRTAGRPVAGIGEGANTGTVSAGEDS